MRYELTLNLSWEIDAKDPTDAMYKLADIIAYNNETVENIFWDSIEIKLGEVK